MGLTLRADNEPMYFDMGYLCFNSLREYICSIYVAEFLKVCPDKTFAIDNQFPVEDKEFIDFLAASDCDGEASQKAVKK